MNRETVPDVADRQSMDELSIFHELAPQVPMSPQMLRPTQTTAGDDVPTQKTQSMMTNGPFQT